MNTSTANINLINDDTLENKNIDVSIVIVNYNVKDYLIQSLRSIYNSKTNLNIQVIVIDNNSTDNSINYLSPIFPQTLFVNLDNNIGFSKANNIGFGYVYGKYTLILNPDTVLKEDTLNIMFELMESDPKIGLSGCKVLNSDGTFQLPCRRGFPTPWVAFTKLFGLQKLFPKIKIFAGYNLTYLDENETNEIEALIGAFMFARTDIIKQIKGFDEDYFMYGEDIDICYRIHKLGYKIIYYPKTTIIHFKGESTKRSNIDELFHFYDAMKIYTSKHYKSSTLFLNFLKLGINLRYSIANIIKYKSDFLYILKDIIIVNILLILSTKLVKGEFFWFPDYAYPKVFLIIPLINFVSKFSIGEYFEGKKSFLKIIYSQMITFFILSSLTYFFKDYAFSRGVILTLIFSSTFVMLMDLIWSDLLSKNIKPNKKRILLSGEENSIKTFLENNFIIDKSEIIGSVYTKSVDKDIIETEKFKIQYLGHFDYLPKVVNDYKINELILIDQENKRDLLKNIKYKQIDFKDKIHFVNNFEDLIYSRIINEITNNISLNLKDFLPVRYKFYKRFFDISLSLLLIIIFSPIFLLNSSKYKGKFKELINVLKGLKSIVGVEEIDINSNKSLYDSNFKKGLITLTKVFYFEDNNNLSKELNKKLDLFYIKNYSISLDIEILIKYLVKNNGN